MPVRAVTRRLPNPVNQPPVLLFTRYRAIPAATCESRLRQTSWVRIGGWPDKVISVQADCVDTGGQVGNSGDWVNAEWWVTARARQHAKLRMQRERA